MLRLWQMFARHKSVVRHACDFASGLEDDRLPRRALGMVLQAVAFALLADLLSGRPFPFSRSRRGRVSFLFVSEKSMGFVEADITRVARDVAACM